VKQPEKLTVPIVTLKFQIFIMQADMEGHTSIKKKMLPIALIVMERIL
jgi:hypothetical protein